VTRSGTAVGTKTIQNTGSYYEGAGGKRNAALTQGKGGGGRGTVNRERPQGKKKKGLDGKILERLPEHKKLRRRGRAGVGAPERGWEETVSKVRA